MMRLTYFCLLAIIGRTLAEDAQECCSSGLFLSIQRSKCWTPESNYTENPKFFCEYNYSPSDEYEIIDGQLYIPNMFNDTIVISQFCMANLTNSKRTQNYTGFAIYCLAERDAEIYVYPLLISVVFLILTVIIYSSLSELRDLQGKSYINLCGSLALAKVLVSIIRLMDTEIEDMNDCAARGFLAYFFLMASVFWTSAVSFQVLWTIRHPISAADRSWKTFGCYAAFAWGIPAFLTMCVAIVNYYPGDHKKPGIGINFCWFHEKQEWVYMYSVMIVLIALNVCMFVYSSLFLWRNTFASTQIATLKYRFIQTIKLVIVMGILWVFEMMVAGWIDGIFAHILEFIVTLQGVWIFLVLVVFRKRVIRAIHKRGWFFCLSSVIENKCLATDADLSNDNVIEHTAVPMDDQ